MGINEDMSSLQFLEFESMLLNSGIVSEYDLERRRHQNISYRRYQIEDVIIDIVLFGWEGRNERIQEIRLRVVED
jgi:hypothetical protein